jgi:hypothetical protein
MHLHYLSGILPAIVLVQAKCYIPTVGGYGLSWADADANVDKLCDSDLAGYFTESQTKYACFQLPRNKMEFWVGWKGHGALSLDSGDCKLRLKKEIHGCDLGGESVVADWYFR